VGNLDNNKIQERQDSLLAYFTTVFPKRFELNGNHLEKEFLHFDQHVPKSALTTSIQPKRQYKFEDVFTDASLMKRFKVRVLL